MPHLPCIIRGANGSIFRIRIRKSDTDIRYPNIHVDMDIDTDMILNFNYPNSRYILYSLIYRALIIVPHSHPPIIPPILFVQFRPHFSRSIRNFANLKSRTSSTQFYLSNEIHDGILSSSSSYKYLYLVM